MSDLVQTAPNADVPPSAEAVPLAIASTLGSGSMSYNFRFVWAISLVAAMGGLLFGYDWVVVGGAKPFYEPYFGLDSALLQGWGTSSALVGCLLGAVACGACADAFGRKRLLIVSAFLFVVSAIGTGLARDFFWYSVFRVLGGVGIGLASNLSPMYIAELAPARVRGLLVSVNQLTIVIGVLLAQLANWLIARLDDSILPAKPSAAQILETWNGQYGWRWMFAAAAAPALAFFGLMFFVPESPRWLIAKRRLDAARRVLSRIGGDAYAEAEIADVRATVSHENAENSAGFRQLLEPGLMKILTLGVFIAVLSQWCGINVIFYYSQEIFAAAGYDVSGIMLNIVITGVALLAGTFIALATVDRVGRRPLMLIGTAGLALTYAVLGFAFHRSAAGAWVVALTVSAIAIYSFTLAPVTWVLLAELFPNRVRGLAMSIAVTALWVGNFTLSFSFPVLNRGFTSSRLGITWTGLGPHGSFWLYGAVCATGFLVLLITLRETRGRTLEEIETDLLAARE